MGEAGVWDGRRGTSNLEGIRRIWQQNLMLCRTGFALVSRLLLTDVWHFVCVIDFAAEGSFGALRQPQDNNAFAIQNPKSISFVGR
jgi:hypothetical protein